jgi:hypothetical protein
LEDKDAMKVRLAKAEEVPTIVDWTEKQYPGAMDGFGKNTLIPVAENGCLRMAMLIQAVMFIWGIPANPKNEHRDNVIALADLLEGAVNIAKKYEVKNLYFVGTTPEIEKQAPHFGFEKVDEPVYRRRIV